MSQTVLARPGNEDVGEGITAIVIPADPQSPVRTELLPISPVDRLKELVGKDLVRAKVPPLKAVVHINRSGADQRLLLNERASVLVWAHQFPKPLILTVFGDMVLTGEVVDGLYTGVSDELVGLLVLATKFGIQFVRAVQPGEWVSSSRVFDTWLDATRPRCVWHLELW